MRHWSIIVLAIVLIACNQQQEHFVSSFEGKISQVLTVLPIEVGDVGSISSGCVYSGGLTVSPSVCLDATYCEDFIPALLNHVADNVVILYHIGSSERINGKIEDDVFTSNDDKVNEQLKAFSNEFESESNKLVSFDSNFENYDDYLKLIRNEIHVEGYSISSNLDKYRIKKLRKLALKWRELRRRQREDSKNELIKTCKAYEAGKVRIEVRVDYLDELCSESASICHCVKEANELLTSWPQDYLLVQQRSGNSLIRSQFRGERYKQELYNVIAKDVAAKAGIGFAKPSILNIEGGNSLFLRRLF